MTTPTTISTDSRGRATLGPKDATFRVTALDDGSLLLEPAQTYTRAELEMLVNKPLRENTVRALRSPRDGVRRRRDR